jgi:CHAD domain-containing protein
LHEFRKRTKDFLYQLFFFRALNPKAIKSLEKRLDDMTQNLGKFNDLSVLVKMLGYKYNREEPQPGLDELVLLIRKEQDRYLSKVWPAAYKIFSPGQRLTNVLGFKMLVI